MKTKTLLIAAATLAVGVISSQAQSNVYSANIVGYVNSVVGANSYALLSNPLNTASSNATALLTGLNQSYGGEILYIYNGTGYTAYQYQGLGAGTGGGFQSDWTDASVAWPAASSIPGAQTDSGNQVYWVPEPTMTNGQGFFIFNPNGAETNTFVGTVVTSNSVTLKPGYSLLGSAIPVAGDVTTNAALSLSSNFASYGGEILYVYNGTGYTAYQYQGLGAGTGSGFQSDWTDAAENWPTPSTIPGAQMDSGNQVYWVPNPVIGVGQGMFIFNPNGNEPWTQQINLQ